MFAVIYQGYIQVGRERDYEEAWNKVARFFVDQRGAIGSCLHRTNDGLWIAYSRWPNRQTRDVSWPGENAPSSDLPQEIRTAILTLKDCLDPERKIPEICMDVITDLFPSSSLR